MIMKKDNDGIPLFCKTYYEAGSYYNLTDKTFLDYNKTAADNFRADYCQNCNTEYKTYEDVENCAKQPDCSKYTIYRETVLLVLVLIFTALKFAD